MKGILGMQDSSKELLNLINFDGAKLVQVAGKILELDRPNITCILCTLNGVNTCFSYILNMGFVNNLFKVSNMVHQVFDRKFHHCYAFYQKYSVTSSMVISTISSL